ncbi:ABC-F family ATP-binding cassette domain-containing protein [Pseudomonas sp. S1Bt30]|uniref:ABC-F family ATP-binding cassette domain-containing protein n=1 Tax=Pseudomonas quebecensis TaxID=2995174 RepID=A0ABY6QLP2_9PSED|nr:MULTISPECIES: ABC-F family ATP-binding cassette domain-containing protein [Pseudomonas]MCX4067500.1 ABC-F family ATP-binding cassette domain-containing protein [Pseudomonas quebecensis]UZW20920.1 ABC-F family ATP-binding cassette domain-containing protein [Pseudomonas quebecensis]UZW21663.1 ABC-F family ATP-binding cassette domain-containing protein [Pseudomonas quebecensis]UZW26722.1 ABC-F family ATP-binding cassette domain-containing protein [Pseudomonas quebecensis]
MAHVTRLPALISLQHVTFQFANGGTLLDDLNLSIDHTPTGIVGRNGSGKSLLAQLIAGVLAPSSGAITRSASVAFVPQNVVVTPGASVADLTGSAPALEALQRMAAGAARVDDLELIDDRWDLAERLRTALDEAGLASLTLESPADQLSGGQLARVALISAFLTTPELLVLDEPTNHLDSSGRAWLLQALGQWRGGLVVVSHDRALLNTLARIIELSPLGPKVYGGNYEAYRRQRDIEQHAAIAALDHSRLERTRERRRLQKDHDTLQRKAARAHKHAQSANVDRFTQARWKSTAREVVSSVRSDQHARKQQLDHQVRQAHERVAQQPPTLLALPDSAVPKGRLVLKLVDVCLPSLDTPALTLSLMGPARVAVQGPNGCGKSTLLKVLAGQWQPVSGECRVPLPAACIDQHLGFLDEQRSVIEHLNLLDTPLVEGELRTRLALLQLDAVRVTQPVAQLSGGERLKAAMAIAMWRDVPAQLLLLDEPTNHLDLASVIAFEQALQGFAGAMVVVSHDQAFIQAIGPTHHLSWTPSGWRLQTA